jgi:hypothetical protein
MQPAQHVEVNQKSTIHGTYRRHRAQIEPRHFRDVTAWYNDVDNILNFVADRRVDVVDV